MPATIVGSANCRSSPVGVNVAYTRAMTVPTTTLIATTTSATAKVRRRAASACGVVAARQKAPQPSRLERQTTAVSGRTTIKLRYMVTVPRSSAAPPRTSSPTRPRVTALALYLTVFALFIASPEPMRAVGRLDGAADDRRLAVADIGRGLSTERGTSLDGRAT